jgi:hypothetical protein
VVSTIRQLGVVGAYVVHMNPLVSTNPRWCPKIKSPAGVLPAGAKDRIEESLSASETNHSIITGFPQTKTQRSSLPPGAGQNCSRWVFGSFAASGDQASTVTRKKEPPAMEQPGAREKFSETRIVRGASGSSRSPQTAPGTTTTNAYLSRLRMLPGAKRKRPYLSPPKFE